MSHRNLKNTSKSILAKTRDTKSRSVVELALRACDSDNAEQYSADKVKPYTKEMDPLFRKICMAQIKLFLFSSHDTTSSSICYTLYLHSKHRSVLKSIQQELDAVFSPDRSQIPHLISDNPHLLNSIPFTTAVIKESLRLFATVSSTRDGERGGQLNTGPEAASDRNWQCWSPRLFCARPREILSWKTYTRREDIPSTGRGLPSAIESASG